MTECNTSTLLGDLEVDITYDHTSEQQEVLYGDNMQPGYPEEAEISYVCVVDSQGSHDITEFLTSETIKMLEIQVLEER